MPSFRISGWIKEERFLAFPFIQHFSFFFWCYIKDKTEGNHKNMSGYPVTDIRYTCCGYEVPEMSLLRDLKGAMRLDCSKDMSIHVSA
jgi:hypothetical protein